MTAAKLKDKTFKHIESELFCYKDTLKEINKIRTSIMFDKTGDDENVGGGRSNIPGRPTEQIATALLTHKRLEYLEEITNAIQQIYTSLAPEYQELIRLKYWTRPQLKTWDGIAEELHVNRTTAIRWRNAIIKEIAKVLGWR